MILEAIVTTTNADGSPNISPMGPVIKDDPLNGFELRPYETSTTFANLQERPFGVLHITDDVLLFAKSAIGETFTGTEALTRLGQVNPAAHILTSCCRWYEFEAAFFETSQPRKSVQCITAAAGRHRDFWGFNRAKHAVIEAAILSTRLDFIPIEEVQSQFDWLQTIIDKTGGRAELAAMNLLVEFINRPSSSLNPSTN